MLSYQRNAEGCVMYDRLIIVFKSSISQCLYSQENRDLCGNASFRVLIQILTTAIFCTVATTGYETIQCHQL
jgi:hypothetical protein